MIRTVGMPRISRAACLAVCIGCGDGPEEQLEQSREVEAALTASELSNITGWDELRVIVNDHSGGRSIVIYNADGAPDSEIECLITESGVETVQLP